MSSCGFDFGTSNSAIGIVRGDDARLVDFGGDPLVRSAIFVDFEARSLVYGRQAVDDYLTDIPGRLIMALKSVLGSPFMDDKTYINGEWMTYTDVLGRLLLHIKNAAEAAADTDIEDVVMGRPVRFHDDPAVDAEAENVLRALCTRLGFRNIEFQHEPIAAALAFEAGLTEPLTVCIADLGGGTSDYSIVRLDPARHHQSDRGADILANHGIRLGGSDLDYRLSQSAFMPLLGRGGILEAESGLLPMPGYYYNDLSRWHRIPFLYRDEVREAVAGQLTMAVDKQPVRRLQRVIATRAGHRLLEQVERVKQALSSDPVSHADLGWLDQGLGVDVPESLLEAAIAEETERTLDAINECARQAGIERGAVECLFLTGGTSLVPRVRATVTAAFPGAQVAANEPFTAVARGLTIDARNRFGP